MIYYKIEENGEVVSVEARSSVSTDEKMIRISADEYETLRAALAVSNYGIITEGGD